MVTDTLALLAVLVVFWSAWWIIAALARRSWLPVIPVYPLVLFGAGYALNYLHAWIGTAAVVGLHTVLLGWMIRSALRKPRDADGPKAAQS